MNPRVRFAPSPTGPLHIGGVRTLLYNYFFAKKNNGKLILRIEDTDRTRFVPKSEAYLKTTMEWLGITPDESPWHGGPHGPYRQSERKDLYLDYAQELVTKGKAYYAFDTPEALEKMRTQRKALGFASPKYDAITRMTMDNSLTLSPAEVQQRLQKGDPYVIRLKVNPKEKIKCKDLVRGWIQVEGNTLDDKILFKSDGMPTYHLAHIVDDHLMQITHVIRGEEWLPSTPIHILIYQAFGWTMPQFVHLPLILREDGQGKLSKRSADPNTLTLPLTWEDPKTQTTLPGFKEGGYLPQAMFNFLALLGWHPSGNQEFFTPQELMDIFTLDRIKKAGVRFDMQKATWLNAEHLRSLPTTTIVADYLTAHLATLPTTFPQDYIHQVAALSQERATFPQDIWHNAQPFFVRPTSYEVRPDATLLPALSALFSDCIAQLSSLSTWDVNTIQQSLKGTLKTHNQKIGKIMPLLRQALIGTTKGPHVAQMIALLGKEETTQRIQTLQKEWQ